MCTLTIIMRRDRYRFCCCPPCKGGYASDTDWPESPYVSSKVEEDENSCESCSTLRLILLSVSSGSSVASKKVKIIYYRERLLPWRTGRSEVGGGNLHRLTSIIDREISHQKLAVPSWSSYPPTRMIPTQRLQSLGCSEAAFNRYVIARDGRASRAFQRRHGVAGVAGCLGICAPPCERKPSQPDDCVWDSAVMAETPAGMTFCTKGPPFPSFHYQ